MTRFKALSVGVMLLCLAAGACLTPQAAAAACLILGALYVLAVSLGVSFLHLGLFGPAACRVRTDRRIVAWTFDDGPDPGATPELLDLLRRKSVPAAFFCVGRKVADQPALAARIVAEGHLIGNHSFAHSNGTNLLGLRRLLADLSAAQSAIEGATGTRPTFFRPPMGLSNPTVFAAVGRLGLAVVGWTVRGRDKRRRSAEEIVASILRKLRPGAIIMLHDGGVGAAKLVRLADKLIDGTRERGYQFVRLDELLNRPAQGGCDAGCRDTER